MRGRKVKINQAARLVCGYVRASTSEQTDTLTAQENRLQALATGQGRILNRVFIDGGFSGGSLKRPAIQELLRCIERGEVQALYVTKLDRICRDLADLLAIVKLCDVKNVAFVSASESIDTGSPAGRMMLSMLGAFAEFERARISERIKDVLLDKRQHNRVYSRNTPFGYRRKDDSLCENEHEQKALTTMRAMHKDGASYRQIASWLRENRYKPRGLAWYASSVRAVLTSRMNGPEPNER